MWAKKCIKAYKALLYIETKKASEPFLSNGVKQLIGIIKQNYHVSIQSHPKGVVSQKNETDFT